MANSPPRNTSKDFLLEKKFGHREVKEKMDNVQALTEIERNLEIVKADIARENKNSLLFDEPITAKRLGIGHSTLKLLRREGKISHVRIGRRVFYRLADIEAFVTKRVITI